MFDEPVGFAVEETEEQFDGRVLELAAEQVSALEALEAYARASPSAHHRWWRLHEQRDVGRPHASAMALAAATAVVQSGLPSCPYAPPGSAIDIQFLPPSNQMVLRCHHSNPAHCWAQLGSLPSQC